MAKIVLLGSSLDTCETRKNWLMAEGCDVRVAQVGAEAIDLGYLFKPDLLVTDWRLKCEYDGIEVAKAFRFANRKVKTILITECSAAAARNLASTANIFQTIMKPLSKAALLGAVAHALAENDVLIA